MSQEFVIEAFPRDDQGRGASRRLRREERKIPAIIYGGGKDATPVAIWHNELKKALENEAFFSHILTIELGGKKESVILKDLQRHPYKPILTKLHGGVANHQINEVEVICLPQNLPEFIEVDMTTVEMDQVVHLSDLKLPKDVKIAALLQGEDHDLPVVAIHKPRGAKVDDEAEEGEEGEESGEDKE